MKTKDINKVADDLKDMTIKEICRIAKEMEEECVELGFLFHNDLYSSMEISFPDEDDDCEEIGIEVLSEHIDNSDGLIYNNSDSLEDLDLSVLLEIYNIIN